MKWLVIFFMSYCCLASQRGESFSVEIHDKKVKVVSPVKQKNTVGFIVTNQTLSNLRAKIATANKDFTFFTVDSGKTKSFDLKINKNERVYLIPLAPPGQEIELVSSRAAYEIPPER